MQYVARKRQRLRAFDYAGGGWFFVTFCTRDRASILGRVIDGDMHRSAAGEIVERVLAETPQRVAGLLMGNWIVMPNHVHVLAWLPEGVSLPHVIGAIKSITAREINAVLERPGRPVWQKSFHDRVVRDEREYENIYHYIAENPQHWNDDAYNPDAAIREAEVPAWERHPRPTDEGRL
jgi:REP element-mobilizing transposase RayT